jgi:hypothetical protein
MADAVVTQPGHRPAGGAALWLAKFLAVLGTKIEA